MPGRRERAFPPCRMATAAGRLQVFAVRPCCPHAGQHGILGLICIAIGTEVHAGIVVSNILAGGAAAELALSAVPGVSALCGRGFQGNKRSLRFARASSAAGFSEGRAVRAKAQQQLRINAFIIGRCREAVNPCFQRRSQGAGGKAGRVPPRRCRGPAAAFLLQSERAARHSVCPVRVLFWRTSQQS